MQVLPLRRAVACIVSILVSKGFVFAHLFPDISIKSTKLHFESYKKISTTTSLFFRKMIKVATGNLPGLIYVIDTWMILLYKSTGFWIISKIYLSQLTAEKANKSDHLANYLDLTFIIVIGGKHSNRLYDRRDHFDFHIVSFPFLSSSVPSGPSYGVYISQLIRYARCCSHCDDFRHRYKCMVDRLLSQGYIALRLEKSFKNFYGRYQDLIENTRGQSKKW